MHSSEPFEWTSNWRITNATLSCLMLAACYASPVALGGCGELPVALPQPPDRNNCVGIHMGRQCGTLVRHVSALMFSLWPKHMKESVLARCAILMLAGLIAVCEAQETVPDRPVAGRIASRALPSVFQAWSPADNIKEDQVMTEARHDLIFHGERFFGLHWDNAYPGLATNFTPASIQTGLQRRRDLLRRNQNLILLVEIRYRDAHWSFLPADHKWWQRDEQGKIVPAWGEGAGAYLQLDFSNPEFREQVAKQAQATIASGVADGIMLDWWRDDADRLSLVKAIRSRIGDEALILANVNDVIAPQTAPFINGYFMECYRTQTVEDWSRIADTLKWAENKLRQPRINCLETWFHESRSDENLMRATTTLSLVLSDGYCLFSDPNPLPTPDHLHNWYPFWERRLGGALARGVARPDGAMTREFAKGTAAYNPLGNQPVTFTFAEPRCSRATGKRARVHLLGPCDGDLFLHDDAALPSAGGDGKPARQP